MAQQRCSAFKPHPPESPRPSGKRGQSAARSDVVLPRKRQLRAKQIPESRPTRHSRRNPRLGHRRSPRLQGAPGRLGLSQQRPGRLGVEMRKLSWRVWRVQRLLHADHWPHQTGRHADGPRLSPARRDRAAAHQFDEALAALDAVGLHQSCDAVERAEKPEYRRRLCGDRIHFEPRQHRARGFCADEQEYCGDAAKTAEPKRYDDGPFVVERDGQARCAGRNLRHQLRARGHDYQPLARLRAQRARQSRRAKPRHRCNSWREYFAARTGSDVERERYAGCRHPDGEGGNRRRAKTRAKARLHSLSRRK